MIHQGSVTLIEGILPVCKVAYDRAISQAMLDPNPSNILRCIVRETFPIHWLDGVSPNGGGKNNCKRLIDVFKYPDPLFKPSEGFPDDEIGNQRLQALIGRFNMEVFFLLSN